MACTVSCLHYFSGFFFPRWARAWTECDYCLNVHTNNGVEAQNKVLKYSFLPHGKKRTLSEVFGIILNRYLPSQKQKFVMGNISQTGQFRKSKDSVPKYLHDRPRKVIIYCLQREQHAEEYTIGRCQLHWYCYMCCV